MNFQRGQIRILGLDPGTHRLGYGIIDSQGQKLTPITYGCLTPPRGGQYGDHLVFIKKELQKIIQEFAPNEVAVEELFFTKNLTTGISVAEARGVSVFASRELGVPVFEYKPNVIKMAVSGYGAAQKKQVQHMVQLLLSLKNIPKPDDAADGLAVAICHSLYRRTKEALYGK